MLCKPQIIGHHIRTLGYPSNEVFGRYYLPSGKLNSRGLNPCLMTRPHPQEGERVWYIMSEFLVVLSQHVRKTGNPIGLLDLLKSCDMKEN